MSREEWTEEDDAAVALEALPTWHPSLFVDVFRTGLQSGEPRATELLRAAFVTPESVESWGDFTDARLVANSPLKVSMTALWAIDAPDVAYVRLVDTDAWTGDMTEQPAAMHATLVWRPEIAIVPGSSWRVHCIGEPAEPGLLPRTASGFDPRKLP